MFISDEDWLSQEEFNFCKDAIDSMENTPWAEMLLDRIRRANFPSNSKELKSFLFELQIAFEFFAKGLSLQYEYPTGLGGSSVDFLYSDRDVKCLIEALSVKESDAVKEATIITEVSPGITEWERTLGGDGQASPGAEMVKLQGKILTKVHKNMEPIKFPTPDENDIHIIIVDARCHLNGGDKWDYIQTMYGPEAIAPQYRLPYRGSIVRGLWDRKNPEIEETSFINERIHFVVFVNRKEYQLSLFNGKNSFILPNPRLFKDLEEMNQKKQLIPVLDVYPAFK